MKEYVLTAKRYPGLLETVEKVLQSLDSREIKSPTKFLRGLRLPSGRPVGGDEILLALAALCDLGILEQSPSCYFFNHERFDATKELRAGIFSTLKILGESSTGTGRDAQLCVSLPPALSTPAEHVIRESSSDLRSSLLDVIASAKQSLILASPFWDAGTTNEMVSLLNKKLSAGVQVWILGRFSNDLPGSVRSELRRIAGEFPCSILSWYEGEGIDTQTFHFKAVSADSGHRAYMGSANMTVSSLRSRMELGVILSGAPAAHLDRILRVVITLAMPIEL